MDLDLESSRQSPQYHSDDILPPPRTISTAHKDTTRDLRQRTYTVSLAEMTRNTNTSKILTTRRTVRTISIVVSKFPDIAVFVNIDEQHITR